MLLERPSFISQFLKCDNEIKLQSGEKICVYTIKAVSNEEKNEWAKHLLNNFTTEQEIINGAKLNNVSKTEYIKQFVLPSEDLRNGSELSGVFGEILFSDFIQYILGYEVPRYKFYGGYPGNPNQGIDIIAYKFCVDGQSEEDEMLFAEIKSRLSCKNFGILQEAIDDIEKRQEKEYALALDAARRKLELMNNKMEAKHLERFQDSENPCKRVRIAGINTSALFCDSNDFIGVKISANSTVLLHVIYANDLMFLAKDLWRRACL